MESVEAYPLHWPAGRPRTPPHRRERSRFKISGKAYRGTVTPDRIRRELAAELDRLGAKQPVISTNVELRRDGLPYASRRAPEDPGVAVYFTYKGKQHCFACDQWASVDENLWAITKTIEALRGIERWGSGDMLERAFSGFQALPAPSTGWRTIMGDCKDLDELEAAYKRRRSIAHPDKGGHAGTFSELTEAYQQGRRELAP